MWRKHLTIGLLVSSLTFVTHAAAQKSQLSGLIGRTFISDQTVPSINFSDNKLRFGDGLTFEVNYSHQFTEGHGLAFSLEVPIAVDPDQDVHTHTAALNAGYWSMFVTPAAKASIFSTHAVSLWGSLGGGLGYFSGSNVPHFSTKGNTTGVLEWGGGLDVRFTDRFGVRLAARDFWSGAVETYPPTTASRQHNVFVGGGVIWRF
jgi:hypothetical protein